MEKIILELKLTQEQINIITAALTHYKSHLKKYYPEYNTEKDKHFEKIKEEIYKSKYDIFKKYQPWKGEKKTNDSINK